jgi:hypothetical protein
MKSFKRNCFLIGVALSVLLDRALGSELAINATVVVEAPESVPVESYIAPDAAGLAAPASIPVTVGLPKDVDPQKVLSRKTALMRAGTEPLIAEKLAIDAEAQQALRDKNLKAEVHLEEVPVTAKVAVVETEPDASKKKGGK